MRSRTNSLEGTIASSHADLVGAGVQASGRVCRGENAKAPRREYPRRDPTHNMAVSMLGMFVLHVIGSSSQRTLPSAAIKKPCGEALLYTRGMLGHVARVTCRCTPSHLENAVPPRPVFGGPDQCPVQWSGFLAHLLHRLRRACRRQQ